MLQQKKMKASDDKEIVVVSIPPHRLDEQEVVARSSWDNFAEQASACIDACIADLVPSIGLSVAAGLENLVCERVANVVEEFEKLKLQELNNSHEAEVSQLRKQLSEQQEQLVELKAQMEEQQMLMDQQSCLLNDQGKIFQVLTGKLMKTTGFTKFMEEVNAVTHVFVRSSTLNNVADRYKLHLRRESWGWHSSPREVVAKAYAEKMLGPMPHLPLIEHLLNLKRPISLQEAEELNVDADVSLHEATTSEIPVCKNVDETSEEESCEEEEEEEEQSFSQGEKTVDGNNAEQPTDKGNTRPIPVVIPEAQGSNADGSELFLETDDAHILYSLHYFQDTAKQLNAKLQALIGPLHSTGAEVKEVRIKNKELKKENQEIRKMIEEFREANQGLSKQKKGANSMLFLTTKKLSTTAVLLKKLKSWAIELEEYTTMEDFFLQMYTRLTKEKFVQIFSWATEDGNEERASLVSAVPGNQARRSKKDPQARKSIQSLDRSNIRHQDPMNYDEKVAFQLYIEEANQRHAADLEQIHRLQSRVWELEGSSKQIGEGSGMDKGKAPMQPESAVRPQEIGAGQEKRQDIVIDKGKSAMAEDGASRNISKRRPSKDDVESIGARPESTEIVLVQDSLSSKESNRSDNHEELHEELEIMEYGESARTVTRTNERRSKRIMDNLITRGHAR